ncbi:MAG: type VI secretion system tube protein Hcp [Actinomycetota bacterium]|nr:type VI secretion system tube protein Hcp [Actinomycetota bacterium]
MAVDMFLKIDGIKGESLDKTHKDEIDILSFGWGEAQEAPRGQDKPAVDMQDFSFVSFVDQAAPELFLKAADGKKITEATLVVRKAGDKPLEYLKIKFQDIIVSSYQFGGSGAEDRQTNQFMFNYAKIYYTYQRQNPDGSAGTTVTRGWDRENNLPL